MKNSRERERERERERDACVFGVPSDIRTRMPLSHSHDVVHEFLLKGRNDKAFPWCWFST